MPSSDLSKKKLKAIVFTDIANFTKLSAQDEQKALDLIQHQNEIIKPIVEKYNGEWLKEIGDGLLLSFDSSLDAVQCSVQIQETLRNEDDLDLRIGIHQGDIFIKDGDVYGDDVNVASRLEPFSAVGGIAISDKVQRDISSTPEYTTKYIGQPKLKGVQQEVKVYCVTSHGLPETKLSDVSAKLEKKTNWFRYAVSAVAVITILGYYFIPKEKEVPSIGILMMENRGAQDDNFWSMGITEDLIVKVAGAGLIRVAPMKEILAIDIQKSFEEIAKKLRVKYLLTSSMHKKEDGFDLRCQLIEAKSGVSKYANKWSEPLDNSPKIVGNLAYDILKSLKVFTKQNIAKAPTTNTEAYEYYLRGLNIYKNSINKQNFQIAADFLKKALELDEYLIKARLKLGWIYDEQFHNNEKAISTFNECLYRSKSLNDKSGLARSLNNIGNVLKQDHPDSALKYYKESLQISTEINDLWNMGRTTHNLGNHFSFHQIHGDSNKVNVGIKYFEEALTIEESIGDYDGLCRTYWNLGQVYHGIGKSKVSMKYYHKAKDYAIDNFLYYLLDGIIVDISFEYKIQHKMSEALEVLFEYIELTGEENNSRILDNIASTYADLGEFDSAIDYYTRSLKINQKFGDKQDVGNSLHIIGNYYKNNGDYHKAMEYFTRALKINEELRDKKKINLSLKSIGSIYSKKGDDDMALEYYTRYLEITEGLGDKRSVGLIFSYIGNIYSKKGNYDKALEYYTQALERAEKSGNKRWTGKPLMNIGSIYYKRGDYDKALDCLDKSLAIQKEIGLKTIELETTIYLYLVYKHLSKDYVVNKIHSLIKEAENIKFEVNLQLYELLEDTSYLETAYNQVQKEADAMEDKLKTKFLSYPIPSAIVEEWEKVK